MCLPQRVSYNTARIPTPLDLEDRELDTLPAPAPRLRDCGLLMVRCRVQASRQEDRARRHSPVIDYATNTRIFTGEIAAPSVDEEAGNETARSPRTNR